MTLLSLDITITFLTISWGFSILKRMVLRVFLTQLSFFCANRLFNAVAANKRGKENSLAVI